MCRARMYVMVEGEFRAGHDGGAPLVTPQAVIAFTVAAAGLGSIAELGVPRIVLCTWSSGFFRGLCDLAAASELSTWWYGERIPYQVGIVDGQQVSVVLLPIGGAGTVMVLEELAAAGAEVFVGIGAAGGLQPDLPTGSCFVATSAVRDEGTSYHYLPAAATVEADPVLSAQLRHGLTEEGLGDTVGCVWTTDAPYRELSGTVDRFRNDGVLAVDMEAAAMFAFGAHRGTTVGSCMVVADVLSDPWAPNFSDPKLGEAQDALSRAAIRCLPAISVTSTTDR